MASEWARAAEAALRARFLSSEAAESTIRADREAICAKNTICRYRAE